MAPAALDTFALKPPEGESLDASDSGSCIILNTRGFHHLQNRCQ